MKSIRIKSIVGIFATIVLLVLFFSPIDFVSIFNVIIMRTKTVTYKGDVERTAPPQKDASLPENSKDDIFVTMFYRVVR
jgi:hypothetical protein